MFKIFLCLLISSLMAAAVFAGEVNIPADRDATLIEDAEGDVASGSGPTLFAGLTNQPAFGKRRGLIHFDVVAVLPENAIIERVSLRLYQNSSNPEAGVISLHRVLNDWGEGRSSRAGGRGAPAEPEDATWLHTFYDRNHWPHAGGGHFSPDASAAEEITDKGSHVWKSTGKLVGDVRLWLRTPQRNFGWLLLGDEDTRGSVKRFASRESKESNQHPVLHIEYRLPGE